jgi:hypothetical protein
MALKADERSFASVARQCLVSRQAVQQQADRYRWKERAAAWDHYDNPPAEHFPFVFSPGAQPMIDLMREIRRQ